MSAEYAGDPGKRGTGAQHDGMLGEEARHGVAMVLDEIQSGMGRTGRFFASEHAGVNSNVLSDETQVDRVSGNAVLNGIPVEISPG